MYYVYDKKGKAFKINHAVDVTAAIKSGNYTKLPPGMKEPEAPKKQPEGEKVEGITAVDPAPVKTETVADMVNGQGEGKVKRIQRK